VSINIGWSKGVVVTSKNLTLRFDPNTKKTLTSYNFISHSHGDHTNGLTSKVDTYLTFETRDILAVKGYNSDSNYKSIKFKEKICLDDLEVIAHNAGHILGSAQFEIRGTNTSLVYTGDVNCRNMLTTKAADVVPCDFLILETTYGHPNYVFPSLGEICTEMVEWALRCIKDNKIPIFQVYSTGKAQEVIKTFNEFTTIPVVVHSTAAKINQAYEKNGLNLTYHSSNFEEGKDLLKSKECIWIVPTFRTNYNTKNHSLAIATGWALNYCSHKYDKAFPLSGHADFNQLVTYVKQVKPKKVFTIHGFKEDFAKYLYRKLGIQAMPLSSFKQRPLHEYV